jgi:hypothetical protein
MLANIGLAEASPPNQVKLSLMLLILREHQTQCLVGTVKNPLSMFLADSRQIDDIAFCAGHGSCTVFADQTKSMQPDCGKHQRGQQPDRYVMIEPG